MCHFNHCPFWPSLLGGRRVTSSFSWPRRRHATQGHKEASRAHSLETRLLPPGQWGLCLWEAGGPSRIRALCHPAPGLTWMLPSLRGSPQSALYPISVTRPPHSKFFPSPLTLPSHWYTVYCTPAASHCCLRAWEVGRQGLESCSPLGSLCLRLVRGSWRQELVPGGPEQREGAGQAGRAPRGFRASSFFSPNSPLYLEYFSFRR